MNKFNKEQLLGIICIIIGIIVIILASAFPQKNQEFNIPGPGFFPVVLSIVLMCCGVYQIILGLFKKDIEPIDFKAIIAIIKTKKVRNVFIILSLFLIFIISFEFIGFIPCLVILLIVTLKLLGVRWLSTAIATVVLTGLIIFLFGILFHISLPSGLLSYFGL